MNEETIVIRLASEEDMVAVHEMVKELAEFERAPDAGF